MDKVIALFDGKPGHGTATLGMIEAIAHHGPVSVERINVRLRAKALRPLLARMLGRAPPSRLLRFGYRADRPWPRRARAIVSTGGDTLYANALLGRITGAPNFFCGSLRGVDSRFFRNVVTNRSADRPERIPNAVILETAPMPKPPPHRPRRDEPVLAVLIGGDGSGYRFRREDWRYVVAAIGEAGAAGARLLVTTSRRTPLAAEQMLERAARDWPTLERLVLWHRSPEKVVMSYLAAADAFIVTADSATMVTEAVLTGRPVFLAGPPPAEPQARHERLLDQFVRDRRARWLSDGGLPATDRLEALFEPVERHPVDALSDAIAPHFRTTAG